MTSTINFPLCSKDVKMGSGSSSKAILTTPNNKKHIVEHLSGDNQTGPVSSLLQTSNSKTSLKAFDAKHIQSFYVSFGISNKEVSPLHTPSSNRKLTELQRTELYNHLGKEKPSLQFPSQDEVYLSVGNCNAMQQAHISNEMTQIQDQIDTLLNTAQLKSSQKRDYQELRNVAKQIGNLNTEQDVQPAAPNPEPAAPVNQPAASQENVSISSLFFRFVVLMKRMIAQSESESFRIYSAMKKRTDDFDKLNALYGKLLAEKDGVDWTKDPEKQALVNEARALGVDIPKDAKKEDFKWSKDQKNAILENVRNKKDTLEKTNKLEQLDMQQSMQNATQMYEWMSNMSKMMKQVGDTIIHNFRAG